MWQSSQHTVLKSKIYTLETVENSFTGTNKSFTPCSPKFVKLGLPSTSTRGNEANTAAGLKTQNISKYFYLQGLVWLFY